MMCTAVSRGAPALWRSSGVRWASQAAVRMDNLVAFDPATRTWTVNEMGVKGEGRALVDLELMVEDDVGRTTGEADFGARAVRLALNDCHNVRVWYGTHARAALTRCAGIELTPSEIFTGGGKVSGFAVLDVFYQSVEEVDCEVGDAFEYAGRGPEDEVPGTAVRRIATRRADGSWVMSDAPLPAE